MKSLRLADRTIRTELDAFVMGILNATPDSFYGPSRLKDGNSGLNEELIEKMVSARPDIIDVGGESTRPGSAYVDAEEEIRRVIPVVKKIRSMCDIPLSVDTRKYEVMRAAFDAGADILNDVSALEDDERLASFAAEAHIPVILMHKRGNPAIMQSKTSYESVFDEVSDYLEERCSFAVSKGVESDRIIVDPGIGFAKNLDGNFELMKNCGRLCGGKYMVLMALSRKSCLGELTGRESQDRLTATVAADMLCVQKGAGMIRVHDVNEAFDSLKVLKKLS